MPTVNFIVRGEKRKLVPVYIRFSGGRNMNYRVKSGFFVDPSRWSNRTQGIRQRIKSKEDKKLTGKLTSLKEFIEDNIKDGGMEFTLSWLQSLVLSFHNRTSGTNNLNNYIEKYIKETESGNRKNKGSVNFSPGTVKVFKGFQRIFNEFQGIYTDERRETLTKEGKSLRTLRYYDFDDITLSFYESFKVFLSDEGYLINTIARFLKSLKYFMQKSLNEGLHKNREFLNKDVWKFPHEESFAVYLTEKEVEKIYRHNLKIYPRYELARDAFIVLCETAIRISDYKQIDLNIREVQGKKLIYITTQKTGTPVVIPASDRMIEILNKYGGKLPRIPEQYINKYIKTIAKWCGITEVLHWKSSKYGKRFDKSATKDTLITCHTGRRTAASNMVKAKIPLPYIMSITGHKSERQLLEYVKLSSEEIALELADHAFYKLKVV